MLQTFKNSPIAPLVASVTIIFVLFLTGCGSTSTSKKDKENLVIPEFFIESRGGIQLSQPFYVSLPISGARYELFPEPVIRATDIVGVAKARVDLGYCLAFQLDRRGALRFQSITADNIGTHIVLMASRRTIGVRLIDGVIGDGRIYIFVEYPDDELDELVREMNDALIIIREKETGN